MTKRWRIQKKGGGETEFFWGQNKFSSTNDLKWRENWSHSFFAPCPPSPRLVPRRGRGNGALVCATLWNGSKGQRGPPPSLCGKTMPRQTVFDRLHNVCIDYSYCHWSLIFDSLYLCWLNDNDDVNGDVDVDVDDADDDDSVFYVDVFDLVYVCKSWARCDFGSVCSDASLFIFSWKGKLRREFINMKSFMLAQMQNFILISC